VFLEPFVGKLRPSFDESLARARGGCASTAGRLFDQFRGYLLAIANHRLDDRLQAKMGGSDLVQQTLENAHRDFAGFRGESEEEFIAWLRRILINQVARANRDYLGTAKRDVSREVALGQGDPAIDGGRWLSAHAETPSQHAMAHEADVQLRRALARLKVPYQQVIELRNRDQQTFAEIGVEMSISEERARRLWTRAVERLRQELVPANG
jgi:RNA polymerase sigma-70 factor (ECF subfamily)